MRENQPGRVAALDGVRALAVLPVVLFHAQVPGFGWGFLGVDVFFVLSGYLITANLLRSAETGGIDLLDFWRRRVRRLLPAAALMLAVVLVWGLTVMPAYQREDLGADVWWTALYLGNWHFIETSSYFDHTYLPSPLQHMWSLAVEEQFYLLWPIVVLAILGRSPGRRRRALLLLTCAVIVVASAARMWWLVRTGRAEQAYMGTDAKAFEPLVGALVALAWTWWLRVPRRMRTALGGLAACGVLLIAPLLAGPAGASTLYYRPGALAFSMAVAVVVAALASGAGGILASVLAWAPLVAIGRISYGVYLWHWPLAVWIIGARPPSLVRSAVVVLLSIVLAAVSFVLVEKPSGARMRRALPVGAATVVALVAGASVLGGTPASGAVSQVVRLPGSSGSKVLLVVGDSVPKRLLPELSEAAWARGYTLVSATAGGCSPLGYDTRVTATDQRGLRCAREVRDRVAERMASHEPGAVLWWSRYETADRMVDGRLRTPDDPEFWAQGEADLRTMTAELTVGGARLLFVETDRPGNGIRAGCTPASCVPFIRRMIERPDLRERWNAGLREVAADTGATTVDVDELYCRDDASPCDDRTPTGVAARRDGSHFTDPTVARAVADHLVAELVSTRPESP